MTGLATGYGRSGVGGPLTGIGGVAGLGQGMALSSRRSRMPVATSWVAWTRCKLFWSDAAVMVLPAVVRGK